MISRQSLPAVDHHWLLPPCSPSAHQAHQFQEVSGVIRHTMVWPGHVLDLGQLPALLALNTHTHANTPTHWQVNCQTGPHKDIHNPHKQVFFSHLQVSEGHLSDQEGCIPLFRLTGHLEVPVGGAVVRIGPVLVTLHLGTQDKMAVQQIWSRRAELTASLTIQGGGSTRQEILHLFYCLQKSK